MKDIRIVENFIPHYSANMAFEMLKEKVNWHDTLNLISNDEPRKIPRKMAYMSDKPERYEYANLWFMGDTWIPYLKSLADNLQLEVGKPFNSVLLNMYEDGKDIINWHADKEATLGDKPVIACLNLGATRKFWFKKIDKSEEPFFYEVQNGDLLIMGEDCQKTYLHAILKEPDVKESRISLTFRYNYHDQK